MTASSGSNAALRAALVRRGQWYSRVTLLYNAGEGIAAIVTGLMAGSIALVGFGFDSVIEVISSCAALWRLRSDGDEDRRKHAEKVSLQVIGSCFLALSAYIVADAVRALLSHEVPQTSVPGIVVAALSVVIMPMLVRGKRDVARGLGSRALHADAAQTSLCAYLSAIVLAGLLLKAVFGWWWADPVAALLMTPIIMKEGLAGLRAEDACTDCAP